MLVHTLHDAILLAKVVKEDNPESLLLLFDYQAILDQMVELSDVYDVELEQLVDEFYHACVRTALAENLVKLGYDKSDALLVADFDLSTISCAKFHPTEQ